MARLLKSNGEVENNIDISSLQKMQNHVNGYVEFVYLNETVLIVNEEGRLMNLPVNEKASKMYGYQIVGDVIHCHVNEIE